MNYNDYEEAILAKQESEADDCTNCPYKHNCDNQCLQSNLLKEEELRQLETIRVTDKREQFELWWNPRYAYLGMTWEAYGDTHYYRDTETNVCYSYFNSIGD